MNDGLNFSVFRAVRPHHSVIVLLLLQSSAVSGQHQVVGPSHPTVALVGDDIILPCRVEPAVSVLEMTVEWARLDLDPRFVYVWHDGMELESKKHPSYSGRTSVSINKLKTGDISLKLSEVKHSDRGRFKCFIPDLGASSVDLVVGAVSSPFIVSINRTSSHLILQCEAKGWYPEPELFWLDAEGNLLSAGPTETVRGPDDLYTVSRRLTVRKSGSFTCRVQQKNINQTRETHFYVPEDFFLVQSLSWIKMIIIISILFTILVCLRCCNWGCRIFIRKIGVQDKEVHHENLMESSIQGKPKVKKHDANKAGYELCPKSEGKKQQDRTERLQTEEASAAGETTEEETKDNSKCSE